MTYHDFADAIWIISKVFIPLLTGIFLGLWWGLAEPTTAINPPVTPSEIPYFCFVVISILLIMLSVVVAIGFGVGHLITMMICSIHNNRRRFWRNIVQLASNNLGRIDRSEGNQKGN